MRWVYEVGLWGMFMEWAYEVRECRIAISDLEAS